MRPATRCAVIIALTPFAGATTDLAGQPARTDYSAPAGAPYTAIDVTIPTPYGHTLAGTLTLPKFASRARPVGARRVRTPVLILTDGFPANYAKLKPSVMVDPVVVGTVVDWLAARLK